MSLVWKEYSQVPGSSPDTADTSRKIFYKMLYLLSSGLGGSPTCPPNIHTHTLLTAGRSFTTWTTRKPGVYMAMMKKRSILWLRGGLATEFSVPRTKWKGRGLWFRNYKEFQDYGSRARAKPKHGILPTKHRALRESPGFLPRRCPCPADAVSVTVIVSTCISLG